MSGLVVPDGAITVGGGEWNYGQTMTEDLAKSMFMLPDFTPENTFTILRLALERLPLDALQVFRPLLGVAEAFIGVGEAVTAIIDTLVVKPALQTVEAFTQWLDSSWAGLMRILSGDFSDVEAALQPIVDWIESLFDPQTWTNWLIQWNTWLTETFNPTKDTADDAFEHTNNVADNMNQALHQSGQIPLEVSSNKPWLLIRSGLVHLGAMAATPNLAAGSDFQIADIKYSMLGGCVGSFSDTYKYWGTQSYRVFTNATSNGGILILPESRSDGTFGDGHGFKVQPGQVFKIYARVFLPYGNPVTPAVYLGVKGYDEAGHVDSVALASANTGTIGSWQVLSGTYTVPTDYQYRYIYPYVAYSNSAPSSSFYLDAVEVRSETNETTWDAITEGAGGNSGEGATGVKSRVTAVRNSANGAAGASTTNTNNLQNTWNQLYDAHNGTSGSTGQTAATAAAAAGGIRTKAYGAIDAVAMGLGGLTDTGQSLEQAQKAAKDTRENISDMNQQINALITAAGTGSYSGNAVSVDFSTYTDNASALNSSIWTQSYPSGSGSGLWGISSGRAKWINASSNDASKTGVARYTSLGTKQDMQRIGIVVSSGFGGAGGGTIAANYIYGRMNAAGSQYVYAKISPGSTVGTGTMSIGYQGGQFGASVSRAVKAGATYWLECGTGTSAAGLRTFRLYENGTLVMERSDGSNLSSMGTSNLFAGFGGIANGFNTPCQVASFAFYDNTPPNYKGSSFRQSRTGTGTASVTATTALMPGGWYDSAGTNNWITSDLTYDSSTNKLTVTKEGWYQVTIVQRAAGTSSGGGGRSGLVLYKNGTVIAKGANTNYPANTETTGASMTTVVYMLPNQYLQPGYESSWAHTAWNGESLGTGTYWQVNFVNNIMPS